MEFTNLDLLLNKAIKKPSTLLGISPISEHLIKAFIKVGYRLRSPVIFVASLNQVDIDGGYTGFTPSMFVEYVHKLMADRETNMYVLFQLDHCGPWLKDEHVYMNYNYNEALEATIKSAEAFIKAGFSIIHVDTTVDIEKENKIADAKTAAQRTIKLIEVIDDVASSIGKEARYEIGSDRWGFKPPELVNEFVVSIIKGLNERKIDHRKILFIVADVGTRVRPGNRINEKDLAQFSNIALQHGYYLKIHSGDYLENLESLPKYNVGGLNVGPMFADVQYKLVKNAILEIGDYDILDKLHELIVSSDKLGKYTKKPRVEEYELGLASRYIWCTKEAREILNRVENRGIPVLKRLQSTLESIIEDFIKRLNLQDLF